MGDNQEQAKAAKARGNAAFAAQDWELAAKEFSDAIALDSTDHVFFSNRSASYANMGKYTEALEDAEECIKIKPDWSKGYSRKGLAAFNLGNTADAKASYTKGLEIDPNNQLLKDGLAQVESSEKQASNPMGQLFGPSMWGKLQANPVTREFLKDPAFVQKCNMLQSNPNAFAQLGSDPQMSQALGVILGIGADFGSAGKPDADMPQAESKPEPTKEEKTPAQEDSDDEMPELEEEVTEEEKLAKENAAKAVEEKNAGNAFYKKKSFTEAIAHYKKAQELDPTNATYLSNESAVYFEQKEYDTCIEVSNKAVELATSKTGYNYTLVGKLYLRIAQCYDKQLKFDEAKEFAVKSRMEDGNQKAKLFEKGLAARRKKAEEQAYLSKEKSEEAKQEGNKCFVEQKWVEAIDHYSEALKRDPTNYKVYSNRAACYTKLMDWSRSMADVDQCLSIDPTFVKAYIRKAKIQHFLKQYHKALETYQKGLDLDPACTELIEGKRATMMAVNQENQDGKVDPERAKQAMKDPEIQGILADPMINNILKQMQSDPQSANRALADPTVRGKIEKLVAAGILQIG